MSAVERLSSYITKSIYTVSAPFHPFGGAVDIIVVQQQDGSFKSSPWYVKFGKFQGVLKTTEKVVNIRVNGVEAGFHMYLDQKGEAYFLREVDGSEADGTFLFPPSGTKMDRQSQNGRLMEEKSMDLDNTQANQVSHIDMNDGKIVAKSNSGKHRFFGFLSGKKLLEGNSRLRKGDVSMERINSLERAEFAADLLETRWSTNLPTNNKRTGNVSKLSVHETKAEEANESVRANDDLAQDINSTENSEEISCLGSHDQVLGISTSEASDLADSHEIITKLLSREINDVCVEDAGSDEMAKQSTSQVSSLDMKHGSTVHSHTEQSSSDKCNFPIKRYVSKEDSGQKRNFSYIYSGAPLSSTGTHMDSHDVISELLSQKINEVGIENAGTNEMVKQPTSQVSSLDLEDGSAIHSSLSHSNSDQTSDRSDAPIKCYVSKEECVDGRVSSCIYSGTSTSSFSGVDVSSDQDLEALELSSRGYKELEFFNEVLYVTPKLIYEENSRSECGISIGRENSNEYNCWNMEFCRCEDSCNSHISKAGHESNTISENSSVKSTYPRVSPSAGVQALTELCPSVNIHFLNSNFVEAEVEVIQDVVAEGFTPDKTSEKGDILEHKFQVSTFGPVHLVNGNEASEIKTCSQPGSHVQMGGVDRTADSHEEETRMCCTFSHLNNSTSRVQLVENHEEELKIHEDHLSSGTISSPKINNASSSPTEFLNPGMQSSDSLEEDQFLFGNIDTFGLVSADTSRADNHPPKDIEEEHELNDMNCELSLSSSQSFGSQSFSTTCLYTEELLQESAPNASKVFPEEVRAQSSPVSIPRSQMRAEEDEQSVGSLPNIRGDIHDLEWSYVLQRLSRSMDVSSGIQNWDVYRKDFSSISETKVTTESNSAQGNPTSDASAAFADSQNLVEHPCLPINHAVEISLCKHLLSEGMGVGAAALAFDGEKLNLEKFKALGPSVLKNDKLVVRIGGQYFPWDAAEPIILGMASFGQECIFESKGMIAVDKVAKAPEGELSIVPSGGSWRLWPFSFRKSKTMDSTQPALDDSKGTDSVISFESNQDKSMNKTRAVKRVMRSTIPTSEEVASLNLKEGQNVITFTFSTPMLGRQKVDARIYLWKWDTKIVVSDVDGTITKSDVLGQFMPLVGKDWSQTGVAHLFSAIKENGFQFIFLSARAISQAYLTRQFLFNLKQDGKALPDGPVVISPDGLFPSLFREVIRRAPHEFKIACLEEIRALFPPDCNPFYAGFGNRGSDEISYLKVGIPKGKIFIINPKGQVVVNHRLDTRSYTSLHSLVNGMFPPMASTEQEDFNTWNYWKMPLPEITI